MRFVTSGGARLPFEDDSFDCVLCVDVIEHLPDPAHFIGEFHRVLRPSGQLFLSFGPPWFHPHGKHMWTRLPGLWTHLLFPRSVVMEVRGYPPQTTWEEIGLHRLSVRKFERAIQRSRFQEVFLEYRIKRVFTLLRLIPLIRELFISEVVGVFRKPERVPDLVTPPCRPEGMECSSSNVR